MFPKKILFSSDCSTVNRGAPRHVAGVHRLVVGALMIAVGTPRIVISTPRIVITTPRVVVGTQSLVTSASEVLPGLSSVLPVLLPAVPGVRRYTPYSLSHSMMFPNVSLWPLRCVCTSTPSSQWIQKPDGMPSLGLIFFWNWWFYIYTPNPVRPSWRVPQTTLHFAHIWKILDSSSIQPSSRRPKASGGRMFWKLSSDWNHFILQFCCPWLRYWLIEYFLCRLTVSFCWPSAGGRHWCTAFRCSEYFRLMLYNPVRLPHRVPSTFATPTMILWGLVLVGSDVLVITGIKRSIHQQNVL